MRKALVVGINDYPQNPLSGCLNDANEISSLLERNEDMTKNFHVRKVLNVQSKADLKGLIIDCFSGDDEIALLYFSGHGYIDSIGGYLVTPDFCKNDYGVSMHDILAIVNDSNCKNKIVILDCCHSGFMGGINTSGQNTATIAEGVTILTASKSDEVAMENGGRGVFTSLLVDAISGGAADVTGHITPSGIYAYIDKSLGPWEQRPVFKTNVTRFLPIRKAKEQVNIEVLRKLTQYFVNPSDDMKLDPSFEPTNTVDVEHKVFEPYSDPCNVAIFSELQKLEGVGLVVPCGEEHMYYAAMNFKTCRLTSAGRHYWRLVKEEII